MRPSAPKLLRLAPTPGERAHICHGLVPSGDRDCVALVEVALAYSHAVWAEFCVEDDDAELTDVLEHAWTFFGGTPRTWLFETIARLEPRVLELARRHGSVARLFAMSNGECCGEWALRKVPARLLRRNLLRDLNLANRLLRSFCLERLERPHQQMPNRSVREVLDEERAHLRRAATP